MRLQSRVTAKADVSTEAGAVGRRPPLGRNVRALAAVSLLTDVSSEMIYPLLPVFLRATLGASATAVGVIEGLAESTAAVLKLGSGWWSDRVPRRKPLVVAGYALSSAVRPLVAAAGSAGAVLAIRLLDRVGKGVRSSPRDALIADSVAPSERGRAYGFHRAADHLGATIGPLVAFALLQWGGVPLRTVFWLAAIPAAAAVLVLVVSVRDPGDRVPNGAVRPGAATDAGAAQRIAASDRLPRRFWAYLATVLLFTLGNATDAFLILRASDLGVPTALVPVLWAAFHVVKSLSSTPGGALSDRVGRVPLIATGWAVQAAVYLGFATATAAWHAWALFAAYGVVYGLVEGSEKALVADLAPAAGRGAAFGWYHLTIGLGALPASALFGVVWDRLGAPAAFVVGGAFAAAAAGALVIAGPARRAA